MKRIAFLKWIFPLSIFWGLSFPLTKLVTHSVSPIIVGLVRVIVASVFFYLLSRGFSFGVKQVINALLNSAIFLIFLNLGVALSPNPGLVAIMVYTQPIFVLIIEWLTGSKVKIKGTIGVVLGVVGVISSVTLSFNLGIIMGLLAGISWAGGTVYYSRNLVKEDIVKLNAFMSAISIPFLALITPIDYYFNINPLSIALLIIIAILAQILGFYFWFNGVRELGSIYASVGSLLVPVMAYILSYIILGVVPTFSQIIGSIITLVGVYLALTS
ncbi:MAG: DMT family transporter [Saccharolobus sp.]